MHSRNAMPAAPTLSVILVCQNPGPRLATAVASVRQQQHVKVELIVVDRASNDGTPGWLETQREGIAALISEPDSSVYAAMNKGLAAAHGEWVYFLGAHDRLVGDMVLSETVNWMKKTEAGVVVAEAAYDDGRIHKLRSHVNAIAGNFVHPPAAFYRRSLFEENGAFDTSLTVMADYDFHVRLWKSRVRFKPIPLRVAACAADRISDSVRWRACREEIAVRHRYFAAPRCLLWDCWSILRFLRQKLVRTFQRV